MKKLFLWTAAVMMGIILLGSCEDDNDVKSKLPVFSDIVFDTDVLRAGETVTATAVQSQKGKLLDRTEYTWKNNDTTVVRNLIYGQKGSDGNPSWTFVVPSNVRTLNLTFTGRYNLSGQPSNQNGSQSIPSGSVVYQMASLVGYVTITKSVRIE